MSDLDLFGALGELKRNPNELSALTLAYIGDAVQELYVRRHLIAIGEVKPKKLQEISVCYVSAAAQAHAIRTIQHELTDEEIAIYKRGRNAATRTSRRADLSDYSHGTGLETLLGYLYLTEQVDRLREFMQLLIELGPFKKGAKT